MKSIMVRRFLISNLIKKCIGYPFTNKFQKKKKNPKY